MKTLPRQFFSFPTPLVGEEAFEWQRRLIGALEDFYRELYFSTRARIEVVPPAVDEIEEGEIVFVDTGSGTYIYTKLNGTVRSAALT